MNIRYISALFVILAAGSVPAAAQELHGDVTVNAGFLPTLRSHQKVSPLPVVPGLSLPEVSLTLEDKGVPTLLSPAYAPMRAHGWNTTKQFSHYRGYLELEGGSYLDFNGSAGYRLLETDKATLGVWLQHLSSTGFKPDSDVEGEKAHAAKRFDETLGIYGSYNLQRRYVADFDLTYHLGYFNYYSTHYPSGGNATPPTQTLNDLKLRVGIGTLNEVTDREGFAWRADLSDRYFGYRRFYSAATDFSPARENNLQLNGLAAYGFSQEMKVQLGLTANYIGYTDAKNAPEPLEIANALYDPSLSGYGHLALAPSFRYHTGNFSARLGLRMDITSTVGKESQSLVGHPDGFGKFHAAPDIALGYRNGRFGIRLSATGGVELRTLAGASDLFYYGSPQLLTTLPLYSPLNASLTLDFGSFSGLSAHVGLAYKITDNTTPDLLYPAFLSGQMSWKGPRLYTLNVKGFSINAGAEYSYSDFVTVKGSVAYQPQSGATGFFNGADRPRWLIDLDADVNPWSTLHITAGYQYRGVRQIWYRTSNPYPVDLDYLTQSVRLNDVTDLHIGAFYTFAQRYTLRLSASNLLGTNYLLAPGMPAEGVRVMGGFAVLF